MPESCSSAARQLDEIVAARAGLPAELGEHARAGLGAEVGVGAQRQLVDAHERGAARERVEGAVAQLEHAGDRARDRRGSGMRILGSDKPPSTTPMASISSRGTPLRSAATATDWATSPVGSGAGGVEVQAASESSRPSEMRRMRRPCATAVRGLEENGSQQMTGRQGRTGAPGPNGAGKRNLWPPPLW